MMKKITFSILVLCLILSYSFGQVERTAGKIVVEKQGGGIVETWNLEKTKVIEGSFFMNESWYVGNVVLKDGRNLENVPLKYNLRDDYLHIMDKKGEVGIISANKIENFKWFNQEAREIQTFTNCSNYEFEGTKLFGVAEVVSEGNVSLLLLRSLILSKGNYSVIHDAGRKNDEYIIQEEFYVNKDNELHKVKNKRTVLEVFAERSDELKQYIKSNNLNVKKEEGLTKLVNYYNSL